MATFYIKLALSPDGTYLLSGSSDNLGYIWNTKQPHWSPLTLTGHQGEVSDVAWCSAEPLRLVTSSDDGTARVWRVCRGKAVPDTAIGEVIGRAQYVNGMLYYKQQNLLSLADMV